jgi:hypothetical protein
MNVNRKIFNDPRGFSSSKSINQFSSSKSINQSHNDMLNEMAAGTSKVFNGCQSIYSDTIKPLCRSNCCNEKQCFDGTCGANQRMSWVAELAEFALLLLLLVGTASSLKRA